MPHHSRPLPIRLFVALLVIGCLHFFLSTWATWRKSATSDEIAHITGGYTYNTLNDYRFHPENGFLPQRAHAVPAALADLQFPGPTSPHWVPSHVWMMGYDFFYRSGNDVDWILRSARAMNALFGIGVVILTGIWGFYFFGIAGALVAALLCALSPTMLAHNALATSDMAMNLFLLGSVSAWWWHLHDRRWSVALLSAVTFGLACVAKHTAVIIPAIFVLLMIARVASKSPYEFGERTYTSRAGRLGIYAASLVAHGAVAVLVIWAFCGFRYSAFNPKFDAGTFIVSWDHVLSIQPLQSAVLKWVKEWQLLPEGFVYGFAYMVKSVEARSAFLDGEYSLYGWPSFFVRAFFYKTTPAVLAGIVASLALLALGARRLGVPVARSALYRAAPLVALFVVYWALSVTSRLNIGHRHILPIYPVLFVACGALGWAAHRAWRESRKAGTALGMAAAFIVIWQGAEAARIHPHYLAYFNHLVGGPANGYRHLVDSSLDWGQDLPALKSWLDENRRGNERAYLAYFGAGEPDYYGIEATRMPGVFEFRRVHPWYWHEPGIYAVSATLLSHVYTPFRDQWTPEFERRYQELRTLDPSFRALKAAPQREDLLQLMKPERWAAEWDEFNRLRFARLCQYLRARRPDASAGYSILIFRLTQEEIDAALEGTVADLANAIVAQAGGR